MDNYIEQHSDVLKLLFDFIAIYKAQKGPLYDSGRISLERVKDTRN